MFLDTSRVAQDGKKTGSKPDICAYPYGLPQNHYNDSESLHAHANFGFAEVVMEVKVSDDPFQNPTEGGIAGSESLFPNQETLSNNARDRTNKALGQLTHYAGQLFTHQYRWAAFQVFIIGNCARLLRWDRSGLVVSEKFNYCTDPKTLCEFFWRYNCADQTQRGYDNSVRAASSDEEEIFRSAVFTRLEEDAPFLAITDGEKFKGYVPPEAIAKARLSTYYEEGRVMIMHVGNEAFLVSRPLVTPVSIVSRGTRGYWAVCKSTKAVVFLKDTWRYDVENMQQEGDIVKMLNIEGIKYVPTLLEHGAVDGPLQSLYVKCSTEFHLLDRSEHADTYV